MSATQNTPSMASLAGVAEEAAGPLLSMVTAIPDVQTQIAKIAHYIDGLEEKWKSLEANPEVSMGISILKRVFPNEWL